jgi:uncharacterized membrane protein
MPIRGFSSGRAFDRLINFSDAVVAVAVTVLVLPIADITLTRGEDSVWKVLGDHAGEVITFFFTFFVVSMMWLTHNRIMNQMRGYDGVIFWLNTAWLAVIAFLPVTSALYADAGADGLGGWFSGENLDGSGMLYWGSLSLISFISALISIHARSNPHLYDPEQNITHTWRTKSRGWVYPIYFLAIGVVSLFSTTFSSYLPIGLIFLPLILKRTEFTSAEKPI